MSHKLFCGVEGGASFSKLVLVTGKGDVLCHIEGHCVNHLLLGLEKCQQRIIDLIDGAKEKANIDSSISLDGLGLCMSGCEVEESNREFEKSFMRKYPLLKSCTVASDTVGPLYSASSKGGLVLIAGTGSNLLLVNPDGTTGRCGGWGHLIGDEGSAMWISLKAVKTVFDHEDNLVQSPFDVSRVKELMLQHFEVSDKFGIIAHCYSDFSKTSFAGLCAKLARAAKEEQDPLSCHLFYEAGKVLAAMVVAVKPNVHKELLEMEGGLPIICVGSVFKSWCLLEKGFTDGIANHYTKCTLMTLNCSAAIGAAFVGAKSSGHHLPLDYAKNTTVLFKFDSSKQ